MPELRDATVIIGAAGLNGGDVTNAEFTTLEGRVTTLEGNTPPTVLDDLTDVDTTTSPPSSGDLMRFDGTKWAPHTPGTTTVTVALPIITDGASSVIAVGVKGDIQLTYATTITGWTILNDPSGSITWQVWRDTYANYPPTSGDLILTASTSSVEKNTASGLSIAIASGETLRFYVSAATTVTRSTLVLTMTREI